MCQLVDVMGILYIYISTLTTVFDLHANDSCKDQCRGLMHSVRHELPMCLDNAIIFPHY